jgi:hypothetical protein
MNKQDCNGNTVIDGLTPVTIDSRFKIVRKVTRDHRAAIVELSCGHTHQVNPGIMFQIDDEFLCTTCKV